jgi:hypothetical protein
MHPQNTPRARAAQAPLNGNPHTSTEIAFIDGQDHAGPIIERDQHHAIDADDRHVGGFRCRSDAMSAVTSSIGTIPINKHKETRAALAR